MEKRTLEEQIKITAEVAELLDEAHSEIRNLKSQLEKANAKIRGMNLQKYNKHLLAMLRGGRPYPPRPSMGGLFGPPRGLFNRRQS